MRTQILIAVTLLIINLQFFNCKAQTYFNKDFTNAGIAQTVTHVANSPQAGREKAGAETLLEFAGFNSFSESFESLGITNLRTSSSENEQPAPGTVILVGQEFYDEYIKVFPNPNTGDFYIEYKFSEPDQAYFIFTDISGKELWRKSFNSNEGTLNIKERIQPGIYLYQIVINNTIFDSNRIIITQ